MFKNLCKVCPFDARHRHCFELIVPVAPFVPNAGWRSRQYNPSQAKGFPLKVQFSIAQHILMAEGQVKHEKSLEFQALLIGNIIKVVKEK